MTIHNTIAHQRLVLSGDRERHARGSPLKCTSTGYLGNARYGDYGVMRLQKANRFKELLRRRLIECGWRDQVRMLCREAVKENDGKNITLDMLVTTVTPRARALVPDTVKRELLQKIKTHLLTQKE